MEILDNKTSMGIVESERQGKIVFYRLADNKINDILLCGVEFVGYAAAAN